MKSKKSFEKPELLFPKSSPLILSKIRLYFNIKFEKYKAHPKNKASPYKYPSFGIRKQSLP
jgi:hypothetical protein